MKPKEPLLAVLLALIFPGLGQIYSGKIKRGLVFLGIYAGLCVGVWSAFLYLANPQAPIYAITIVVFFVVGLSVSAFGIFMVFDAYKCAQIFNGNNNLIRHITAGKKGLLIFCIIIAFLRPPLGDLFRGYMKKIPDKIRAYKMPAGSMGPTLRVGDRLLVDKVIYRESRPERGDIIIFQYPADLKRTFVKRLIAFGGETVEIREGKIYINGQLANEPTIKDRFYYNRGDYGQEGNAVKVPEGYYYVLGDNSASSHDSRFWGFVPEGNLIGKVFKIYWPLNRVGFVW